MPIRPPGESRHHGSAPGLADSSRRNDQAGARRGNRCRSRAARVSRQASRLQPREALRYDVASNDARGDHSVAMTLDNLHSVDDVGTRVRELSLLHEVTRILRRDDLMSATDLLHEIMLVIQRWWPYSGTVGVRARLGAFEVETPNLDDVPIHHCAEFTLTDGREGAIEVASPLTESGAANPAPSPLLDDVVEMFRTSVDRRLLMTALRESEQRYRSVVEQQSDLVCRYLPDTTLTFVNHAYCRFFGKRRDELIGRRFIDLIPPADQPAALEHIESLLRGGVPRTYEHTVLLPDGSVGRQQWIDQAITSPAGIIEELQGIGRDITDRWHSEEALRQNESRLRGAYQRIRSLAHRLMLAQEAERTEIARDLHDDVGQQLAALEIGLSLVEARADDHDGIRQEVERLRQMASGLAEKVRHVSHALHPGVLQHAGLSAAIASHCEAVASQHSFLVRFETRGTFDDVPDDIALCLYRAVQQALRNVAMHANASRVRVSLARTGDQVELSIVDNGSGFDPSAVRARGLGLLSIEERVHIAQGKFTVTSSPGGGSSLVITVPVGWE
jgi:PAS domain S-box-containing protein